MRNFLLFLMIVCGSWTSMGQLYAFEKEPDLIELTVRKQYELLAEAIDQGADVNARDGQGRTALHYAAKMIEDPQVLQATVKLLLQAGADWEVQDNDGKWAAEVEGISEQNKALLNELIAAHVMGLWLHLFDIDFRIIIGVSTVGTVGIAAAILSAYYGYRYKELTTLALP